MTLGISDPFERRCREAGPGTAPVPHPKSGGSRSRASPEVARYIGPGQIPCKLRPEPRGAKISTETRPAAPILVNGFAIHKARLDATAQTALVCDLRAVAAAAPFFQPVTPRGQSMSVRMTSAGAFGWISDRRGYRYEPRHPSGVPWPPIPTAVLALWRDLCPVESGPPRDPDCCLVNFYGAEARMGLHRDADEADFRWPVMSISLGDPARFRMGGRARADPTTSMLLESGDVVVMAGAARLAYHGVDHIRFGGSRLLPEGGRINLTCRVVT